MLNYHPFIETALTYYNIPYIYGTGTDQRGNRIRKTDRQGFTCLDCSGLVVWTLVRNNINLYEIGTNEQIVASITAHRLWEICRDNYYTNIAINGWQNGDLIFLDSTPNDTTHRADHVMIWSQNFIGISNYGWVVHALGGDTRHHLTDETQEQGKVVYQPMPDYYITQNYYFDGAFIPATAKLSLK